MEKKNSNEFLEIELIFSLEQPHKNSEKKNSETVTMRKNTIILLCVQLTAFAGDKLEDFKRKKIIFLPCL